LPYYISREDKIYGPFEISKIQALADQGKINQQNQICEQGQEEWKPLSSIITISPVMNASTPPPPPPPQAAVVLPATDPGLALLVPVGRTGTSVLAGYLGLVSIFLGIVGPFAIIVGVLALKELNANPGRLGHGRAWFGIIGGILGSLWFVWFILAFAIS
jgi:hypothetical protein